MDAFLDMSVLKITVFCTMVPFYQKFGSNGSHSKPITLSCYSWPLGQSHVDWFIKRDFSLDYALEEIKTKNNCSNTENSTTISTPSKVISCGWYKKNHQIYRPLILKVCDNDVN